jgi:hypothetical protein
MQKRNASLRALARGTSLWLLALACTVAAQPAIAEPISLFNGKDFTGWEGDTEKAFRIDDGCIVGGTLSAPIARNEFLSTKQSFGDFELRLKFKLLGKGANAGVQVRSQRIPDHHEMIGYQADLGDLWWGCLYDESRRNKVLARPDNKGIQAVLKRDEWNDYRIRCQGLRIQLWVNEFQTVDYTEADESLPQTGLIGLQIHGGPPSEAWYKDLVLEEL